MATIRLSLQIRFWKLTGRFVMWLPKLAAKARAWYDRTSPIKIWEPFGRHVTPFTACPVCGKVDCEYWLGLAREQREAFEAEEEAQCSF